MRPMRARHPALTTLPFLLLLVVGGLYVLWPRESADGTQAGNTLVPITFAQSETPAPPEPRADILFVGDLFFDRHIRRVSDVQGGDYLFSCIDPLFARADFVVGNLEGPITENPSVSVGTVIGSANNYRFTFPTSTAPLLARHYIKAVTIGNNHIGNFGWQGLQETHQYLSAAGVEYFGGLAGDEPVWRTEDRGIPLSFVSYNAFGGDSSTTVAARVAREREEGRTVIVFAHWGVEYSTSTETTRPIAQLFAQSGAAAIIGSHPHVVGVHEYLGNTLVYYSLGNFLFDQYWESDVTHGLAVMLHITPAGVTADEYPVVLHKDGRTCVQ